MPSPDAIAWLPWNEVSFARARAEGKPVLLSIAPRWCPHSARMDRTSYADPDVARLVNSRFVPVRVDADRRPDVSGRYGLGGWPTTAFLTPDGDLLGGGTFVDGARLGDVLVRLHDAFAAGEHARAAPGGGHSRAQRSGDVTEEALTRLVRRSADPVHGGFGGAPKFPHVAPVRLALALLQESGADGWRDLAVTTLDRMGWGPLYDEEHGGFYRCCRGADWSEPSREKLLEVNAALLSLYLEAFEVLRFARYGERAEDVLRYLQTTLADRAAGGWAGSERHSPLDADAPEELLAGDTLDRTLYTDWNAAMISAALQAGHVMQEPHLAAFAIASLERIVLLCYRPGAGVAHYADPTAGATHPPGPHPGVGGMLDDQVALGTALLDAFDATGNTVYQMLAQELALYATRTMWDEAGGGFFDRAGGGATEIGLLRERVKPFVSNCAAARMLARLAPERDFGEQARRTLAAVAPLAEGEGPMAADYLLAVRQLREG